MSNDFMADTVKRIKSLRKSYNNLRGKTHDLLCDIGGHYVEHHDPVLFTRFMEEMKNTSLDRRAVAAWCKEFMALDYVKGKKGFHFKPLRDENGEVIRPDNTMLNDGKENPFYGMDDNSSVNPKPFDLLDKIKSDLKSYRNRQADPEKAETLATVYPEAFLERLEKMLADMEKNNEKSQGQYQQAS